MASCLRLRRCWRSPLVNAIGMDGPTEDHWGESKVFPNGDAPVEPFASPQLHVEEVGLAGQAFEGLDLTPALEPASEFTSQQLPGVAVQTKGVAEGGCGALSQKMGKGAGGSADAGVINSPLMQETSSKAPVQTTGLLDVRQPLIVPQQQNAFSEIAAAEVCDGTTQESPAALIGLEEKELGGGLCVVRGERDSVDNLFEGSEGAKPDPPLMDLATSEDEHIGDSDGKELQATEECEAEAWGDFTQCSITAEAATKQEVDGVMIFLRTASTSVSGVDQPSNTSVPNEEIIPPDEKRIPPDGGPRDSPAVSFTLAEILQKPTDIKIDAEAAPGAKVETEAAATSEEVHDIPAAMSANVSLVPLPEREESTSGDVGTASTLDVLATTACSDGDGQSSEENSLADLSHGIWHRGDDSERSRAAAEKVDGEWGDASLLQGGGGGARGDGGDGAAGLGAVTCDSAAAVTEQMTGISGEVNERDIGGGCSLEAPEMKEKQATIDCSDRDGDDVDRGAGSQEFSVEHAAAEVPLVDVFQEDLLDTTGEAAAAAANNGESSTKEVDADWGDFGGFESISSEPSVMSVAPQDVAKFGDEASAEEGDRPAFRESSMPTTEPKALPEMLLEPSRLSHKVQAPVESLDIEGDEGIEESKAGRSPTEPFRTKDEPSLVHLQEPFLPETEEPRRIEAEDTVKINSEDSISAEPEGPEERTGAGPDEPQLEEDVDTDGWGEFEDPSSLPLEELRTSETSTAGKAMEHLTEITPVSESSSYGQVKSGAGEDEEDEWGACVEKPSQSPPGASPCLVLEEEEGGVEGREPISSRDVQVSSEAASGIPEAAVTQVHKGAKKGALCADAGTVMIGRSEKSEEEGGAGGGRGKQTSENATDEDEKKNEEEVEEKEEEEEGWSDFGDFEEAPTPQETTTATATPSRPTEIPETSEISLQEKAAEMPPKNGSENVSRSSPHTTVPSQPSEKTVESVEPRGSDSASWNAFTEAGGGAGVVSPIAAPMDRGTASVEDGAEEAEMLLADRLLALSVAVFDQAFGAEGRGLSERKREVSDCGEGAGTPFESLVDLTVIMRYSKPCRRSQTPFGLSKWATSCILRGIRPVPDSLGLGDSSDHDNNKNNNSSSNNTTPPRAGLSSAIAIAVPAAVVAKHIAPPVSSLQKPTSRIVEPSSAPPPPPPRARLDGRRSPDPSPPSKPSPPSPVQSLTASSSSLPPAASSLHIGRNATSGKPFETDFSAVAAAAEGVGVGMVEASIPTLSAFGAEFTEFSSAPTEPSSSLDDSSPAMPSHAPPPPPPPPPLPPARARGVIAASTNEVDVGSRPLDAAAGAQGSILELTAVKIDDINAAAEGGDGEEDGGSDWADDPFDDFQSAPAAAAAMMTSGPLEAKTLPSVAIVSEPLKPPEKTLQPSWNLDFLMAGSSTTSSARSPGGMAGGSGGPSFVNGGVGKLESRSAAVGGRGGDGKSLDLISQALAGFGIEDSPGREEVNQSSSRHSPPLFPFLRSTADGAVSVGGGDVIGGDRLSDLLRATRLRGGSASPSPVPLSAAAQARVDALPDLSFMLSDRLKFPMISASMP